MDEILAVTTNFELLNEDGVKLTLQRGNEVKMPLKKLRPPMLLIKRLIMNCGPTGSRIGFLYGLPKTHKPGTPLTCSTPYATLYQLSCYRG